MDAFSPQPTPAPPFTVRCVCVYVPVCVSHSVIPWTIACQAPPSMKFSKQEYWPAVPFPSPGGFPDPGVKAGPAALQPDSLPAFSPQPSPSPTLYHKGSCISLWMLCTCSFICPWPWSVHTVRPSGPESTWDHLGRKFWSPGFRSQV